VTAATIEHLNVSRVSLCHEDSQNTALNMRRYCEWNLSRVWQI